MNRLLLASMLFCASVMSAEPPQSGFNLIGFNGETAASDSNLLAYQPGDEEDEDDGIYRFVNESFEVVDCTDGFKAVGIEGMTLGFDEANEFGFANMINQFSTRTAMVENGPSVKCELPKGTYKVILASFMEDELTTWMIQFQSVSSGDEQLSYYLTGFNGNSELTQSNRLVKEVSDEGETFSYPKFLVENCADGFQVSVSNGEVLGLDPEYASFAPEITDESPMAFLAAGGAPVPCSLSEGYYSVTFASAGATYMISFMRCDDQTPPDESTFYLCGFNGVDEISDDYRFTRVVVNETDEDGVEQQVISYSIKNLKLSSCANGFTVTTADGGFLYGLDEQFAEMLGDTINEESPFSFMGIYGKPIKCELPEAEYDVTFIVSGTQATISFIDNSEGAVEGIYGNENLTPVYFDLHGRRVKEPTSGIYIVKQGKSVTKIIK